MIICIQLYLLTILQKITDLIIPSADAVNAVIMIQKMNRLTEVTVAKDLETFKTTSK